MISTHVLNDSSEGGPDVVDVRSPLVPTLLTRSHDKAINICNEFSPLPSHVGFSHHILTKLEKRNSSPLVQITNLVFLLPLFQDVLHTICNPNGPVQRIVIFKKNGVQAMVEYPFVKDS